MEVYDLSKTIKNHKIAAGTVLLLQGQSTKTMTLLHSGVAEMLYHKDDIEGKSPQHIIDNSIRVGIIKGESVCGILGLRSPRPYSSSIRTVTDCIISSMPIKVDNVITTLQSSIKLNLKIMRALVQRIESAVFLFNNYKYLWHKLASIADTLALGLEKPVSAPSTLNEIDRYNSDFSTYSEYLKQITASRGLPQPEAWDHNLFLGRLQSKLGLYTEEDLIRPESTIDYQQFLFLKRLMKKKDQILTELFYKDEPSNYYTFQFLNKALEQMVFLNEEIVLKINLLIRKLFHSQGWIKQTLEYEKETDSKKWNLFNHYLGRFVSRCRKDAIQLLGRDLMLEFPIYKELKKIKYSPEPSEQDQDHQSVAQTPLNTPSLSKYDNLLDQILEFADVDDLFKSDFTELIEKFLKLEDKLATDKETAALKNDIAKAYWELYEILFFKVSQTDLKNFIPGITLHFGLIDERLVTKEELAQLDNCYSESFYLDESSPIMTLPYFLDKIYSGEVLPSISEMGDTFDKFRKQQEKMTKKEREGAYLYKDTPEDRVRYEIREIAKDCLGMLFGSKKRSVPILCSEAMIGRPENLFFNPEKLAQMVENHRNIDFSVFYREVVIHHKHGSDIMKREQIPNFVFYPVTGTRMMMWQELDGTKRNTRGRIFLPLFYNGKKDEDFLLTIASFRWELSKTMAGAKWTDAVDGGMVGAYYDYINFYRKNPHLSSMAKDQVKEFIKKTRSDKERFCKDYLTWVTAEFEGNIKLNAAARDVFYRFCPFKKEMREIMAMKPLFTALETKYQNRVRKTILKMESRKKKFEKSNDPAPEELLDYLAFLEM